MYNENQKFFLGVIIVGLMTAAFAGTVNKGSVWIAVGVTSSIISLLALIRCYVMYHEGTGQPRDISELVMDIPHLIVFRYKKFGYDIVGLARCSVSNITRTIIPQSDVIVYRSDKVPKNLGLNEHHEFIMATEHERTSETRIEEWKIPPGYNVHE